jgi:hypothetical protein
MNILKLFCKPVRVLLYFNQAAYTELPSRPYGSYVERSLQKKEKDQEESIHSHVKKVVLRGHGR